jgi:regulator of protease activity HflC (stomatin/prohibitin superfamily)
MIAGIGAGLAYAMHRISSDLLALWILGIAVVLASVISSATQVANQWSRAVVLRLGKFRPLNRANDVEAPVVDLRLATGITGDPGS